MHQTKTTVRTNDRSTSSKRNHHKKPIWRVVPAQYLFTHFHSAIIQSGMIFSFIGKLKDRRNLALTCKSFYEVWREWEAKYRENKQKEPKLYKLSYWWPNNSNGIDSNVDSDSEPEYDSDGEDRWPGKKLTTISSVTYRREYPTQSNSP